MALVKGMQLVRSEILVIRSAGRSHSDGSIAGDRHR
jgi:hypothetical protein